MATLSEEKEDDTKLWHMRLGHMSVKGLLELHKRKLLIGIKTCSLDFCKFCVFGKQHKLSLKQVEHTTKGILDYVHTFFWGPTLFWSKGGAEYFLTFIDDYSRKVWVYFMKHNSEVFEQFKLWKVQVEKATGRKVKYLRSDNGGEYKSREFQIFYVEEGIRRHYTMPYGPEQNGVAERMNRTLTERAKSMRLNSGLPEEFWAKAVNMACYLVNKA